MMTIRSQTSSRYAVRCDHCGTQNRTVADGFSTRDRAIEDAVSVGWVVSSADVEGAHVADSRKSTRGFGVHLCPDCAAVAEPCS